VLYKPGDEEVVTTVGLGTVAKHIVPNITRARVGILKQNVKAKVYN